MAARNPRSPFPSWRSQGSGSSACAPGGGNAYSYLTATVNGLNQRTENTYYRCTGALQGTRDQNDINAGRAGTTFAYDFMGLRTDTWFADGGHSHLAPNYGALTFTTTQTATPDPDIVATVELDGLGRVRRTHLSDPQGEDILETTFELGRVKCVTNPYRTNSDGSTCYTYDGLGRVAVLHRQDGGQVVTQYEGDSTLVTDEAGKARRSYTDALGRLIQVDEPNAEGTFGGGPATPGTGQATLSGAERIHVETYDCNCYWDPELLMEVCDICSDYIYDTGSVSVAVNGLDKTVWYDQYSTASSLAAALAAAFNNDPNSPVTANPSGAVIQLTAKQTGSGTNYPVSTSAASNNSYFTGTSFSASGANLSGGSDGGGGPASPVTIYKYDALDNLTCVEQHGGTTTPANTGCDYSESGDGSSPWRIRRFTYNSLSQLTRAKNPEFGIITYQYNNDGVLTVKTDARGITINYDPSDSRIDALHRVTKKTYSNGDAAVTYTYDESACLGSFVCANIGRRTRMADGSGSTYWSYDPMGRPKVERRSIDTTQREIDYGYDLAGALVTIAYPHAADPPSTVVTYTYNSASRPLSVAGAGVTYAQSATYAPFGGLLGLNYGNGVVLSNGYNPRQQPTFLSAAKNGTSLFSRSYDFHYGAGDNGNVYQIQNNLDGNRTQNFQYDALNRVQYAWSSGNLWGNWFQVDAWGNLNKKYGCPADSPCYGKPLGESLEEMANEKNQFIGHAYDGGGNLIDSSYAYDAENRLRATGGVTYTYDGDGKRVKKSSGTLYWTGVGADALWESNLSGVMAAEYVYFGGKRIARRDSDGTLHYYISDHLGSGNIVTDAAGAVKDESDFYPFGGERVITDADPNHYKFTGKERDAETGLDYFGARYYGSTMGRWTSVDPITVTPDRMADPQRLNLYAYVRNNPIIITDPDGRYEAWMHEIITQQVLTLASDSTAGIQSTHPDQAQISDVVRYVGDGPGAPDSNEFKSTSLRNILSGQAQSGHFPTNGRVEEYANELPTNVALGGKLNQNAGHEMHAIQDGLGANGQGVSGMIGHVVKSGLAKIGIGSDPDTTIGNKGFVRMLNKQYQALTGDKNAKLTKAQIGQIVQSLQDKAKAENRKITVKKDWEKEK